MINYLPKEQRKPDTQLRELLTTIRDKGRPFVSPHPVKSRWYNSFNMRYDLRNGVPFLTERDVSKFWESSINEIFAFANGVDTLEGLTEFGVNPVFWRDTVTEEKCAKFGLPKHHLGYASYGPGFARHPGLYGEQNQFELVFNQMKHQPYMRTHEITPWITDGIMLDRKVVTAPCHGVPISWHIYQNPDGEGKDILDMTVRQRSGDVPIGIFSNLIQYSALHIASAHVLGLEAREYVHNICNAHYYDNQVETVEELIKRDPMPFPKLVLTDDAPYNILDFRSKHFRLEEYESHKGLKVAFTA